MRPVHSLLALGLVYLVSSLSHPPIVSAADHPLRVSSDGRRLLQANGKPFLYLADTAWELFHRLDRDDAELYLRNRAAKGFTVIQAVLLAELDGVRKPNANGDLALIDGDPTKPNPKYFEHADWILAKAESLGLTIAMLPAWGDKWHGTLTEPGPRVFTSKDLARGYARFVGGRFKNRAVIFVLGGDRNVDTKEELAIVRGFAQGLEETAPQNLITFHPRGPARSSTGLHKEEWLDFNMVQSSHTGRDFDSAIHIEHDRKLKPAKPTLDAEPRYEDIILDFYYSTANKAVRADDVDVRLAAYGSLLAGAAGHTYGNANVWQMWSPTHEPQIGAKTPWREAIDHPGAFQMRHLRRLFESRPWDRLVPDGELVVSPNPGASGIPARAAVATDRSFAFVYVPRGEPVAVELSRLKAPRMTAWWFDPRYGHAFMIYDGDAVAAQSFTPPTSGRGQDWVLVLDQSARKFPPPGSRVESGGWQELP
jgi:hypothetical protein